MREKFLIIPDKPLGNLSIRIGVLDKFGDVSVSFRAYRYTALIKL